MQFCACFGSETVNFEMEYQKRTINNRNATILEFLFHIKFIGWPYNFQWWSEDKVTTFA